MPIVTQNIPKLRAQVFSRSSAYLHDRANMNSVLTSMSDSEHLHSPSVGNLFALDQDTAVSNFNFIFLCP